MYDAGKILLGLIIFLAFATFPFYTNMGKAVAKPDPKLDTPVIQQMKVKQCVESKEFMRAEHMQLLNHWRDAALRRGERLYKGSDGRITEISFQNQCLRCHSNKKKFCDECHSYAAVKPYCWDCHIAPKEAKNEH
ncbi:MAG: sulfate reduction electron transfer complex DsrMKJOP subunit DsrJ [Nitrospirota bacterium]|nr:sulfate reduction electron transfer complex DsrMKJOP subunit DsrJ [Nitrospirota bacterium]